MKDHLDKTLRFWVDCEIEGRRDQFLDRRRGRNYLTSLILQDFEAMGHAKRYIDKKGRIAWRATESFIEELAAEEAALQGEYDSDE